MPHPMRRSAAERNAVQLIEADVEAGFALIDEARAYRASGQPQLSSRVRLDAAGILADIERRLHQLGDVEPGLFHCLAAELRNELAALGGEPDA
jgi:hypothetical protein